MSAGDGPPSERHTDGVADDESLFTRFRTAETGPLMFVRELLTSMATVAAVGLLLFAISGVWPPMVAVESGSMDPHMQKGDLIFVTEPGRYMPDFAHDDTGVVTYRAAEQEDYRTFGSYGSVVVYKNPSTFGPPIIHRARFWVDEGENWYDEADPEYVNADSCAELLNCPAPHGGFVTKGDNNPYYDQANGISSPVKPEWVVGTARLRIPYLGWIRLGFSGAATANPVVPGVASAGGPVTPGTGPVATTGLPVAGSGPTVSTPPTSDPVRAHAPREPTVSTDRPKASTRLPSTLPSPGDADVDDAHHTVDGPSETATDPDPRLAAPSTASGPVPA